MATATEQVSAARRGLLSRTAAFWLVGVCFVLMMFAVSAPSPLYGVYQARWHFSELTLTSVFAIYALVLLATLLVTGRLSDHLGRRPVILAALVIQVAGMALFAVADATWMLFVARALQGLATGLATSALSAGLIELQPPGTRQLASTVNSAAPTIGLALGGLATSALVQYAPAPRQLVFLILIGAFLLTGLGVLAAPEPGARRPGALASLRPRVGIPREARGAFLVTLPCLVSIWALSGLYMSLGPSLAATLLRSDNRIWGGLAIFLMTGTASAASILLRALEPRTAMARACAGLLAGLGMTIAGIASSSGALFLAGSAVAGFGFGLAFLGAFRMLSALAPPTQRAGLITTFYVVSYLALSVPIVVAGVAASSYGLHATALVYAGALMLLVALTAVSLRRS